MKIKFVSTFVVLVSFTFNLIGQSSVLNQKEAVVILSRSNPEFFNGDFNIYVQSQPLKPNSSIKYIRNVKSPDSASWFFFVDERPYQSWGHPCSYIFVNEKSGAISITKSDFPPELNKMKPLKLTKMPSEGRHFSFPQKKMQALTLETNNDYAIIISGGMDDCNNYYRYWNDCSAIYSALVNIYNFDKSHIKVLISDGTSTGLDRVISVTYDQWGNPTYQRDSSPQDLDGDGIGDINYSATKANISTVFNYFSNILTSQNSLFVFTADHGGSEGNNNAFMYLWGQEMRDDEFSVELNKVHCGTTNIVMGQCFSGGFIDDLQGDFRIIATACNSNQYSYSRPDLTYDEFLYHWISAISSSTPDGAIVNADSNSDGWISIQEAFTYARTNDSRPETPQYNSLINGFGCISKMSENSFLPLSNSTLVCSSGQTFTVNNIPAGCSPIWSSSSNINLSYSQGNSAFFNAISDPESYGFIQVNMSSTTCGSVPIPRYSVWAGTPKIEISGPSEGYTYNTYTFNASFEPLSIPSSFTWILNPQNGNNIYNYGSYADFAFYNAWDTYQVVSRAQNTCGFGEWAVTEISIHDDWGFSMSPNPATSEVKIDINQKESSDTNLPLKTNSLYTISIYNLYGMLQVQNKHSSESFTIPVYNLKDGNYIVKISNGKTSKSKQLIIKH